MNNDKYSKSRFAILTEFNNSQLSLRSFISRYVISPQDIDDVSQETFLRVYKAEKEKEIEHPKAFLFRIAKILMLSDFSRKARNEPAGSDTNNFNDQMTCPLYSAEEYFEANNLPLRDPHEFKPHLMSLK